MMPGFTTIRAPRLRTGMGPLAPSVLNPMIEAGGFVETQRPTLDAAIEAFLRGWTFVASFLAKTTAATAIPSTDFRWKYSIAEIIVTAALGTVLSGNPGRTTTEAINLCELLNEADWIYPGWNPENLPEGYEVLPVGGQLDGEHHGAPVHVFLFRKDDGSQLFVFAAPITPDGTCPDTSAEDGRDALGLGALAVLNTVGTDEIDDDAVTYAKLQDASATDILLGRATSGAGEFEEIPCTAAGRAILAAANAAAQRTALGLGSAAVEDCATSSTASKIPKANGSGKIDKAWIPDFVASGGSHASGGVPDPGASSGTTHFLREDGSWAIPAPPGSNKQVAYNNSGAWGSSGSFLWDDSAKTMTLAGDVVMMPTSGQNAIDITQATLGSGYFLVLRYPDGSQAGRIDGWGSLVFPGTNTFGDCFLTAQSGNVGLKVQGASGQDVGRIIDHSGSTQWKWTADGAAYDGNNNTLQRVSTLNTREVFNSQSVGSGNVTIDWSSGAVQRLVCTNAGAWSPTVSFTNFPAQGYAGRLRLIVKVGSTAPTFTWSGVTWDRNTAPTITVSKTLVITINSYYDGTPALILHGWAEATGITNPTN